MSPEERALIDGLFDRIRSVEAQQRDPEAQDLIARRVAESPVAAYALVQSVLVQDHALQQAMLRVQELEGQLEQAQVRIADAEENARAAAQPASGGGFFGGLLGGGRSSSVPNAGARSTARPGNAAPMGAPAGFGSRSPQPGMMAASQQAPATDAWGRPVPPQQPGAVPGAPSGPWGGQQGGPQARPGMMGGGGGGFLQNAMATAAGVAGGALLFSGIQSMLSSGDSPVAQQAAADNAAADSTAADDGGWNAAPQDASFDNADWSDSGSWDDGGFDDGGWA